MAKRPTGAGATKRRTRLLAPAGITQMRALAHPLRLRLLELFAAAPRTTKQAAEAMGAAPTGLYHHVAALEHAGLVRLTRTRRVRGATEKYYELAPNPPAAVGATALRTAAGRRDAASLAVLLFEEARRDLVAAIARYVPDEHGTFLAVRGALRLNAAEQARLRRALVRLLLDAAKRSDAADAEDRSRRRWSLTIALVPAEEPAAPDAKPARAPAAARRRRSPAR